LAVSGKPAFIMLWETNMGLGDKNGVFFYGWEVVRLEGWKVGRMEGCEVGRKEGWKVVRLGGWEEGRL
jgi:hypothetical protein